MSIFNSENPVRTGPWLVLFLCGFLLAAAIGELAYSSRRFGGVRPLVSQRPPSDPDYYLAAEEGVYDHKVLLQGLKGTGDYLRQAQIIFLGSSRVQLALRAEQVLPFCQIRGLKPYFMGFGQNEGIDFALSVLQSQTPRPSVFVIDVGGYFFRPGMSELAKSIEGQSNWTAATDHFDQELAWSLRLHIHRVLPYFFLYTPADRMPQNWPYLVEKPSPLSPSPLMESDGKAGRKSVYYLFRKPPYFVIYRSARYGFWNLLYKHLGSSLVKRPEEVELMSREEFENALMAKSIFDQAGVKLILTEIPNPLFNSQEKLRALGKVLDVPIIESQVEDLKTFDGSHLDQESAKRFAEDFLPRLDEVLQKL